MKIYFAGTPGTEIRERERVVKDNQKKITVLLGYSTKPIWSSLCF